MDAGSKLGPFVMTTRFAQMRVGFVSTVPLTPSRFDIWFMTRLAKFLGRYPIFGLCIQSGIRHHVFGGFWFAVCLFLFWTQGARPGGDQVRRRVLTILIGSTVAIVLALLFGQLFSWLPPSRNPVLAHYYPSNITEDININSFPSQSTALYAAVAAGIFSLNKVLGSVLWVGVAVLVSLPRVFIGGHYPTDVLAGLMLGLLGYFAARSWLEPWLNPYIDRLFEHARWPCVLGEFVVFVWILQIAVEFREFVWIKDSLERIIK
jgi:membrane-associated phospholipid phosphatase